jgi:hypothetical protein
VNNANASSLSPSLGMMYPWWVPPSLLTSWIHARPYSLTRVWKALDVLTRIVVDVGETSGVELELSRSSTRSHGGLSCLTLMPG